MSPVAALAAPPRRRAGRIFALAGILTALTALFAGAPARAAAVVDAPRSDVATVTCSIEEGGATTCAVSQGAAAICSLRKGQDITRSYRAYDYLNAPLGCSLDIDYWRSHAPGGTANYDETWGRIGSDGADTAFFGSESSFADMLAPAAEGEDAYRTLSRAYVAAELNRLNDATLTPAVEAALNEASVLLLGSPGGDFDAPSNEKARTLSATLSDFVAGRTGPGSCRAMTEPIGPEDVGKILAGVESGDKGTILRLDENKDKPGEGLVTIGALTAEDQFIYADEAFTVEGIRKARFTQDTNDCVTVDAGEETTIAVGGIPSDPTAMSARMQQLARNLLVMIALNNQSETPAAPASGPAGPSGPSSSGSAGGPSSSGFGGGFPSPLFPPVAGSGGDNLIPVPDVIGRTEGEARGIITSARLSVGTVTTVSSLAPPSGGFVSTAYAQTTNPQPVVVRQSPVAGTMCVPGCPVDIFLSSGAQGMPEPSTLPMIAVALAALGLLVWRRGRGVTNAAIVLLILTGCENRAVEDRIALAKQFIESGRPNGAVVELKRAIQDEPGNAEARRLLGHAYVGLGRFQDAEKELTRAVSIDPDSAGSALALATVWLRQGEVAQLLSALQPDANWSTSEQSMAWSLRGEAELAAGRPQEARQSFERAASLDPESIDPLIGLFRADSAADQPEAADAVLQRALALHPADPILLGLKGARSFASGDFTAAEDAFRRQLERTPDNLGGRIDLAQALLAQGQDHQAQAELSRVLADAPNHPDAHYLMAVIDMRRANYTAAAEHSGRALQSRPQFLPIRAIAARAAAELGRWEESRAQLDAIRVKDPMHPLLAELKPRLDEAMRTPVGPSAGPRPLEQDLALFRLDPPADPSLLDALAAPGTLPRSFETELARAGPSWLARGRALAAHRAGRPVEARFALQGALDRTPDDADTRRVLVDLYLLAGEPNAALPHLRRLVRDNPRDPGVLNNLAWTLYERGELREAALLSERALALAPRDPGVLDTRGMILLRSGEASRALELLGRAASTDLAPPESRVHLAQALIESGDKTAARQVLTLTLNTPQDASAHRAAGILLQTLEP